MINRILILFLLISSITSCSFFHSNYSNKKSSALLNAETVVIGRLRIYQIPKDNLQPVREISHLCKVSNYNDLEKSPFYEDGFLGTEQKLFFGFYNHGLFAVAANKLQINNLECNIKHVERMPNHQLATFYTKVNDLNLKIENLETGKINYVGDINVYINSSEDNKTYKTEKVCSWHETPGSRSLTSGSYQNASLGGALTIGALAILSSKRTCSDVEFVTRNKFYPNEISLENNLNNTLKDIRKILDLPNNEAVFKSAKLDKEKNAKKLYYKGKTEFSKKTHDFAF